MLKIKPVRGALALLLAVSLCLVMSLTAFLIDTPAMREHAEQAVDLLGYESASPEIVGGFASSRLDNYTAVLILKTAAYIGDDPLLRMAFSGLRTDLPPQEDQTDWEAYATYSDAVPSPNNVPYSRYWHGYTFALRLLLSLFTFTNLQMLLLFAQTALLLWTVLLMVRRGLQQLIPAFAVSWFFMSPPALGLCLQYAPVSLIALLACSLLLALKPALSRSVGLPVFFVLIGLFVNYFDLLTFPVVSLSFPLILLIALETKTTISFGGLMREALLCCIGWALGYACMWMLKWGLNFLVLGQDGIAAVGDQISLRLSAGGESHSRLDILLRNIRIVTDKTAYRVILLAVLALLLWTVLLMVRRGLQQLIPAFAVSWFFMSPPALGLCLQYAPVSLIALLACSLLLALKPALSRSVGLPVFFVLIGLFVNYFDLLTFPVVSLSFPLILLIALETKTTISFGGLMREALLCCIGWALGYACMWMLKWGLNFLVLGQDGIAAVGDQISLRLSAGGESHSRLDILLRNIRIVTDKTAYRVILLAVLALLLALFIRRRPRRFDGRALLLLLPLLAPVLWTLALSNHASDHTYFTYRNLCGAFFALFALPALLAPDRTPSL